MSVSYFYVARKACGCLVYAAHDAPHVKATIAEDLPELIRAGLAIERITHEAFKSVPFECDKCRGFERTKEGYRALEESLQVAPAVH